MVLQWYYSLLIKSADRVCENLVEFHFFRKTKRSLMTKLKRPEKQRARRLHQTTSQARRTEKSWRKSILTKKPAMQVRR